VQRGTVNIRPPGIIRLSSINIIRAGPGTHTRFWPWILVSCAQQCAQSPQRWCLSDLCFFLEEWRCFFLCEEFFLLRFSLRSCLCVFSDRWGLDLCFL